MSDLVTLGETMAVLSAPRAGRLRGHEEPATLGGRF